jgi:hypothetical protein
MIFLDNFFTDLLKGANGAANHYTNYTGIPDGCKIIGIAFYDHQIEKHQLVIDSLVDKTETLLVYFSEPTRFDIINYIKHNNNPKIKFFSDTILNIDVSNLATAISWFIYPTNFYAIDAWANPLLSQLHSNFNKPKRFDCLLGRSKPFRDIIEEHYNKSQYADQIIFSYYKDLIKEGIWDYSVDQILESHEQVLYADTVVPASAVVPVSIYNQSYYSIVPETICDNRYSQFTEKVAKPIVAKRLFVCFSGQYYLRNLKLLGFKTFSNVIDESYDNIADTHKRFAAAWQQVEYLCEQDPEFIIAQIQDILTYNYQHFISTNWHSEIKKYFILDTL